MTLHNDRWQLTDDTDSWHRQLTPTIKQLTDLQQWVTHCHPWLLNPHVDVHCRGLPSTTLHYHIPADPLLVASIAAPIPALQTSKAYPSFPSFIGYLSLSDFQSLSELSKLSKLFEPLRLQKSIQASQAIWASQTSKVYPSFPSFPGYSRLSDFKSQSFPKLSRLPCFSDFKSLPGFPSLHDFKSLSSDLH